MDTQELWNLQEAYMEVYRNLDEEGATSQRLADLANKRIGDLPPTHHIRHRRGTASLSTLSNLWNNASRRAKGTYPQQSGLRRGAGGAGVPNRAGDSVTPPRNTRRDAARALLDKETTGRNTPLTPSERPIPIRSRPTPPTSGPTSRTNTPLTPKTRDERAAAAGFKGQGSLPKGKKLYRQTARGVTTGDDPMKVLQSAAQQEHYDLYDIILLHLLDEGYAETVEAAEVMMVNMSEEWRESIIG